MRVQEQRHSMKDTLDQSSAKLVPEKDDQDNFANRKLIRPALPRVDHNNGHGNGNHNSNHGSVNHASVNHSSTHLQIAERRDRHERPERGLDRGHDFRGNDRGGERGHERSERSAGGGRKTAPPDQTNAENFYYQKQMQTRTPMVVVLQDGEEVHGIIEWYDKTCIKVNRDDGRPNLMIYKPAIKYMFKEEERGR
jgi:sRNA-binding regulator protein Hfq